MSRLVCSDTLGFGAVELRLGAVPYAIDATHQSRRAVGQPQTMTTDDFLAVRNGNLPLLKHLIAEKKTSLTHTRWSGMTLLHRAADVAQVEIIKYLMEISADASAAGVSRRRRAVASGRECGPRKGCDGAARGRRALGALEAKAQNGRQQP